MIVAVTRIRNEDDIVEAFVRHHAALVDAHVLLDNCSNDRTLDILKALRAEGLPLHLFSSLSATVAEAVQNTRLLRQAAALGAEWVVHLDCDEFIDPRPLGGSLRDVLARLPAQAPAAHMGAFNYHPTAGDDAAELVVPRRLRWRDTAEGGFVKVLVRGRAVALGVTTGAGNHEAYLNGAKVPAFRDPRLRFAHYYMRSGWQSMAKAVVGMMKIYAAGAAEIAQNNGIHYTHIFENLRDHPEWLLDDRAFLEASRPATFHAGTIDDPIAYLGGPLRYAEAGDARLKAVRSIMAAVETMARRHGELADATEATRRMVDAWGSDFRAI